ncbi:ABC transporter ATP-binding protein [Enterovirga aerilata]|uniref:ABC transporter ATP-binding protein n=1 Tax=Enterovirga aerilata TaxID=2730920 RepID=A0A849I8T7_9HYPH|nr:ABC transporter ATP-binding protein [Enterovirga sp. DB1703]NNM72705.1 ABC transporter ATP-binding protein [Enterovirga sp. DB1703]
MILSLDSIEVRYGQAVAVDRVSLGVGAGKWVLVMGPNGAGKSSLLRAAIGLVKHRGRITFEGRDLSAEPTWIRQRLGIGYVPEGRQLFTEMTVEENLRVGGYGCSAPALRRGLDLAYGMFPRLAERRGQIASTMSGGEQQMLAMARALMIEPKLLLVDEISWGLSPILVAQVFATLVELHAGGIAILQVEQNAFEALKHAQSALVMSAGRLVLEGAADEIARDRRVVESYIGA